MSAILERCGVSRFTMPERPDRFEGSLRQALAEARKRRPPVSLPALRSLEARPTEQRGHA